MFPFREEKAKFDDYGEIIRSDSGVIVTLSFNQTYRLEDYQSKDLILAVDDKKVT